MAARKGFYYTKNIHSPASLDAAKVLALNPQASMKLADLLDSGNEDSEVESVCNASLSSQHSASGPQDSKIVVQSLAVKSIHQRSKFNTLDELYKTNPYRKLAEDILAPKTPCYLKVQKIHQLIQTALNSRHKDAKDIASYLLAEIDRRRTLFRFMALEIKDL